MYFCDPNKIHEHKGDLELADHAHVHKYPVEPDNRPSSGAIPPLNILILIVGSRGDVQPFIAFGKGLVKEGHRVRLSTHVNFKKFVEDNGLLFHPLKGDPEYLMNFMVNHPSMITVDPMEIMAKQKMMEDIYHSTWDAATLGFRADVVISNPPVHVHVHLAQQLQVPLHIMFTMPWSPTGDYKHPLTPMAHLFDNRRSYYVVDNMIWAGLGSAMNRFRKAHGLNTISGGADLVNRLRVPMTYCMSPHLAPKPTDWAGHIDVVGFWFLDLKSDFTPPEDLVQFMKAGDPPLYIGFGSIVVDNPAKLSKLVIDAIIKSGKRAVVSPGWAKIGEGMTLPPQIKLIGAVPHDWLFQYCSMVCHHGGAGTLAAGLKSGLPTIVVPFFGDQPFWGSCVARMKVGPEPIPYASLSVEKLTEAILFCDQPAVKAAAKEMGTKLQNEDGVGAAVSAFHRKLPVYDGQWHEEVWENQRVYITGWSHKLLPTDHRSTYTDITGLQHLELDKFTLPPNWKWVSDWESVKSDKTDPEGWMYGVSFSSDTWKHSKGMTDFVRTRKLYRTRIYTGGALAPIKKSLEGKFVLYVNVKEGKNIPKKDIVGLSDPFCEISVKGQPLVELTRVIDNTATPKWEETFWFEVTRDDTIVISCFDKDPVGKEFIGTMEFKVSDIIQSNFKTGGFRPLETTKEDRGSLHIEFSH